jgi:predicted nucleic acid-binding protein
LAFLDTNVLIRHILADHPDHSPRASSLILRIQRGEIRVEVSETVLFETIYLLERRFRAPKAEVRSAVQPIIELPGIVFAGKRRFLRALDFYTDHNLPIADALHAAITETLDPAEIISFDHHFRRVATITLVEP